MNRLSFIKALGGALAASMIGFLPELKREMKPVVVNTTEIYYRYRIHLSPQPGKSLSTNLPEQRELVKEMWIGLKWEKVG